MPIALNKILLCLSIILALTLFIGTHAMNVGDADHLVQSNHLQNSPENIHHMGKRRFLPTRRELYHYINADVSNGDDDDNEEDQSHLNAKRYFLKSKRYFLNSKRDNERREEK